MTVSTRFGGLYGNITEQAKECQERFEVCIFIDQYYFFFFHQ